MDNLNSFETNAIHMTNIVGWVCKQCKRYWGKEEYMAHYCCAPDTPCTTPNCAGRARKGWTVCKGCIAKRDLEQFEKMEARPYDGTAVVQFQGDNYLWDEYCLAEYLADYDGELENVQLVFAEKRKPKWNRYVSELLDDELYKDCDWDTSEIDNLIAAWVDEHAPDVYHPTKIRVDTASIAHLWKEARNV